MKRLIILLIILVLCSPAQSGIQHDDTDDKWTCGTGLDITGDLTISVWLYDDADASGFETIFGKWKGTSGGRSYLLSVWGANNKMVLFANRTPNSTYNVQSTTTESTFIGGWHHWAATYDDTNKEIKIFYDGTNEATTSTVTGSLISNTEPATGGDLYGGKIDELCIWDTELSDGEIAHLASARVRRQCLQIQPANLQAYYPLDEISDGVSADGSSFINQANPGGNTCTGDDGANNTGLTGAAGEVLSYP